MKLAQRLIFGFLGLLSAGLLALFALHRNSAISTDIWIDSPPQAVWKILTDTADYPSWNPEISRLDGPLRVGQAFEMVEGSEPDAMVFHPTLLALQPDRELRWKGYVGIPGIFDGEHRFLLEAVGGRTHLIQDEKFSGILAGRLTQEINQDTIEHMQAMNRALKKRLEPSSTP